MSDLPDLLPASTKDLRVPAEELRWRCDPKRLSFETTADVEPLEGVIGQDDAIDALRFGLEIHAPGQNVYVRGLAGTGRLTLVRRLLEDIQPECPLAQDRLYVFNFDQRDRPTLITLPRGKGREFERLMDEFADFCREDLKPALGSDTMRARREALETRLQEDLRSIGKPFDEELRANDLTLVQMQVGNSQQTAILPLVGGKALAPEEFETLRAKGEINDDQAEEFRERIDASAKRFREINESLQERQQQHRSQVRQLYQDEARSLVEARANVIARLMKNDDVTAWLGDVTTDLVENRLKLVEEDVDFTRLYRVNLLQKHRETDGCPIVVENAPTMQNLLGNIDRELSSDGQSFSDHTMIRAGSLLQADGGYLILEARDVLSEPGAWKALVRTLRSGRLEITPPETRLPWLQPGLKPEPIEVNVKVVLIGDPGLFHALDSYDPDFPNLFKVLADFETTIARDDDSMQAYAGVLSRIVREEKLQHFDRSAVAALTEHGARVAAEQGRLTARFGRLADLAREASYLARKASRKVCTRDDVEQAIVRSKRRADLPARRFRKLIRSGTIRIETRGRKVGQVNGLAVVHSGPLTYGFPSRITSTIGPGSRGTINIEREAQLSGSIHTKGFYILGGLLRHLLPTSHPLAFSASIAFEQSYGGIDGDSASGAEICCLLSALTGIPVRQEIAMTGAIDQHGHIQAIGAANEKIEGFFDACCDFGLTGTQGVIIPRANVEDLMLRDDVVAACERGEFHVYAVDTIQQALEVFSGLQAGELDEEGLYPEGSLLDLAVVSASEYWLMAMGRRNVEELEEEVSALEGEAVEPTDEQ